MSLSGIIVILSAGELACELIFRDSHVSYELHITWIFYWLRKILAHLILKWGAEKIILRIGFLQIPVIHIHSMLFRSVFD